MIAKTQARVLALCGQAGLFLQGQRVAAAVSGGADSMALLRILLALDGELGIELTACHVNHGLRGAGADRDEAFVRAECGRLGVPLRVFRAGEEGLPPAGPGEEGARRLRYACFARLHAAGIDRIATAHTVTDQAETLLFRLARGTGLHGAAGIRPARDCYARPLLGLTRGEVEDYCRALGQRWVTDETNLSDDYARNRLRHYALPALRQANAEAERNLARFCERAARADAYFAGAADALLAEGAALARAGYPQCPPPVRRALDAGRTAFALAPLQAADELVLEQAAHGLVGAHRDPEEKYVRLICDIIRRGAGAVQLRPDAVLRAGEGFFWQESAAPPPPPLPPTPFCPEKQAEYPLGGGKSLIARLTGETFQEKTQGVHKKDLKNVADYAKITISHPALILRSRLPGDSYRPAGRGVSKPLRKWMNEQAIPPERRDSLPLLADGSEILWVCGAGFAEGLAPSGPGGPILRLEIGQREIPTEEITERGR